MAAVPSEVSLIAIASAAPHRSLPELHYKSSPSEARTVPRSPRSNNQVQKDECLVPILFETTPLVGQSEIDTGDPPSASGVTLDHIQQPTAIDVTCPISEETPVTGEPSSPTVLPQTNGRHVQVENTSRLPALRDTVHCTTTLTQYSHSLCECRPWTTPKTLPTEPALRDRTSNELDVEDRLAQMRHQVLKDCSGRIYVPLQANTSPLVSNTKPLPLMPMVLDFIDSKRRIFLLLGDSGSGKSTFCWQLVRTLWNNYTKGSQIPIFVDLRDIDRLSDDLIESQLQEYGFSDTDVRELLHERQFVLVCDGYDESRLSTSIYTKRLGQLGVKMIVSCRSAFLGWDYQGRFYPLGDNRYHGECSELFDEAIITPFQKTDIQKFIKQYVVQLPTQGPSDNPSAPSFDDYWEKLSIIPNMMGLVSNPFLLTLALRALPSLSIDFQDLTNNNATRLQLYDGFVEEWIRINIARLQQSNLNQDYRTVFDSLLNDGFAWCVKDFSKRLAEAMHEHQKGRLVVKFRYRRTNSWKTEFFGDKIESTLLRESSLLSRAGFRHWFIHKSLFDYFRSLVLYDPDESDDDESDDDESDDNDSNDDWGDPHDGGGNPFSDGGDGRYDDGGDFIGGDGSLSGGNFISTRNSDGSAGGGGGGSSSSSSGSTGANSDSPDGNGSSSESNGGSAESNGGSPGDNSAPMGGNGGSGGKDGPSGNGDSSHQGKDSYRSRRKASKKKSRPSSDPFSTQNLLGDPEVLEFLAERAQSDSRLKKQLLSAIEQSKALSVPSLAAANAITILFKSGIRLKDADLDVLIPNDYISTATRATEPVQLPERNLTAGDLIKAFMTPTIPASVPTIPTSVPTIPASVTTVPAISYDLVATTLAVPATTLAVPATKLPISVSASAILAIVPEDASGPLFEPIPASDTNSNSSNDSALGITRARRTQEILNEICNDLNQKNCSLYGRFLRALLDSRPEVWDPSTDLAHDDNPITLSLRKAKEIPGAIEISRVMIKYCIRMAKQEKKPFYVVPVLRSLQELVRLQNLHIELVLYTLERLAFIPVENESIVINQAIVAHPLKFPWPFRNLDTRSIYDCQGENPVFQTAFLGHGQSSKCDTDGDSNQVEREFSLNVFVASYNLLWDVSGSQLDGGTSSQSWLRTLIYTILFKLGIKSNVNVKRHAFDLKMLDNPAIEALVEYRWNTIGHAYWLVRFYSECIFYSLVLGVFIARVYGGISRVSLFSVNITIIVMALMFLVFKVFSLRRNHRCSPNDFIDGAVFALPLVGSIIQTLNVAGINENDDISFLSFSVLFIFLHFLLELRIKKNICQFVTFILKILAQIRLFVVIFALGTVAFALIITHFLRECPISDCSGLVDTKLSKTLFRASSITMFFLTGTWGSFEDSPHLESRSWRFDLIMISYVMTMALCSLNLLIALMNVGFYEPNDTSTAAWIDFKLSYVEEAESITYNIPGFREAYKWRVPDVIYYTATLKQQENYEKHLHEERMEKPDGTRPMDLDGLKQMTSQGLVAAPSSS